MDQPITVGRYRIAPELFTTGYTAGKGPCTCSSHCCAGGVFMDVADRERILAHRELIARHMDATQVTDPSRWFDDEELADSDFPSGRCVGSAVVNDKCVFLDARGLCSLQAAAVAEGMHKWAIKPLYCILFPIEVSEGTVGFDDMLQGEQVCCTTDTAFVTPAFRACREELEHLLGAGGYAALEEAYTRIVAPAAGARQEAR